MLIQNRDMVESISYVSNEILDSDERVTTFRVQKWHSVLSRNTLSSRALVASHDPRASEVLYRNMAMSIVEAAHVKLLDGSSMGNVDAGLLLAVHAKGRQADTESSRLRWNLRKDWVDTFNAWNLEFVSRFNSSSMYPKLFIPSVMCTGDGTTGPHANAWVVARMVSLKLLPTHGGRGTSFAMGRKL